MTTESRFHAVAVALHKMSAQELDEFATIVEALQEGTPTLTFRERLRMWAERMVEYSARRPLRPRT